MPLASSGSVNLTTVRDYYGSSSNNMTALLKGGSFVPNPSSYNSGTQTSGAANANANVPTSTSVSDPLKLTDFRGGRKLVTNAATANWASISESGDTGARGWVGLKNSGHQWYQSGYNYNYANVAGTANYGQLLYILRWGLAGGTASWSINFSVNVTGEYYAAWAVQGNGGSTGNATITGSGVASGGSSGTSLPFNTTVALTPTLTADTTITMTGSTGTAGGGGGDVIFALLRTNCNADGLTIGSNAGNNYSLM